MKLMIVGHGRHGKDTVCEILRGHFGLSFTSSSRFIAAKVMMPAFRREAGDKMYDSVEDCFNDRHNHRKFWYDEIVKYCSEDRARLTREIFEENDVYCGNRQVREFMCSKNARLFDFSIWVDRSEHQPPESKESMSIEPWMCDYWLDNNGTLEDLERNLGILAVKIGLRSLVKRGAAKCLYHRLDNCAICNGITNRGSNVS